MYRTFILSVIIILLLSSCSLSPIAATEVPSPPPSTQAPMAQPASQTGQPSPLEIISPQNWERLQLLQSFPAEMLQDPLVAVITPDEKTLVIGSRQRAQLFFFDLKSEKIFRLLEIAGVENINARFDELKYLSDGSIVASSSGPYMIYRIDSSTGDVLSTWEGINFALSADEQTMAVDSNGTSLINMANNTPITVLKNTDGWVDSLSPDKSKIAFHVINVSEDTVSVDIWDIKSQTTIKTLPGLYLSSYSPNGKFLVGISNIDSSLKIFSADGAVEITTISDKYGTYLISPDGSLIAYQTTDRSSIAMDTTNWEPHEMTLSGTLDSFSPGGHMLVTRTEDGSVLIWGVPLGAE
jgi:hypothetical protein